MENIEASPRRCCVYYIIFYFNAKFKRLALPLRFADHTKKQNKINAKNIFSRPLKATLPVKRNLTLNCWE